MFKTRVPGTLPAASTQTPPRTHPPLRRGLPVSSQVLSLLSPLPSQSVLLSLCGCHMNTGPHLQPGLSGHPWDVPGASDPMGSGAGPPPACDPGAGLMTPALSGTLCLVCIAPRAAGSSFPPAKVAPPRLWTPLLPSPVRTVQMPCPHCGRGASRCRPAPLTPPPCLPLNTPLPSSCFYSNKRDGGLTALPSATARTPSPTPGALPSQPPVGDQASLASPTTQSTSGPSNSLGRRQASQLSFHLHDPGTYTGAPTSTGPGGHRT